MTQHKLSLLAVTLIGALACQASYGLVGIEDLSPDSGTGSVGATVTAGGAAGATSSGGMGGGKTAARQGIFVPTGSMSVPRFSHTATMLPNGQVLVAGGMSYFCDSCNEALASAELYDPTTGTFTAIGSMTVPRYDHTATLLPSGQVLIVGGVNTWDLASAELYDPATGTFTATGSMTAGRAGHTAMLLTNGKVLIVGDHTDATSVDPASAELYDPVAGTFTATGKMNVLRASPPATLLSNGKVLIAGGNGVGTFTYDELGGCHHNGGTLASAELYDPATRTFTATGSMTAPRYWHRATLFPSGMVLITGGRGQESSDVAPELTSAELYDPAAKTFTATGSMTSPRSGHTATLLCDGKVLVAGGSGGASADLYDAQAGRFTATGSMTVPRYDESTATLLSNGQVLIAGGVGVDFQGLASAELYQ
jgi:hypothetical protein